jgi:ABC-type multidrug transport system fused ATPase/permease subunit
LKKIFRDTVAVLQGRERKRAIALMMTDLLTSVADILFLASLVFLIDYYSRAGGIGGPVFLRRWLAGAPPALPVTLFFLLFAIKNLAGFLVYRAQCRFLLQVALRISKQNLAAYLRGDFGDYVNVDSSAHVRRISYDPMEFAQHVLGGIQQIVTQVILIVLAATAIVLFNATLFLLLVLILLPPVAALVYLVRARRKGARDHAIISNEKSLQHLQEALEGYVESNIYGKNDVFLRRYLTDQQEFNGYIRDQMIVQGIPNRLIEIFALLGVVILLLIQGRSGATGGGTFVTVGVLLAGAYKIIPGIVKIMNLAGQVQTYAFCVRQPATPGIDPRGLIPGMGACIQSVEFCRVRFSYNGKPVLKDLSWQMMRGDFMGVSGCSGMGKTTILNLLLGFLTADSADPAAIRINRVATDSLSRQRYWHRISYVKQQTFLIHDTILHNITLEEKGHAYDKERLEEAIRGAGLEQLIRSFPERLDKIVMENGKNLSGGQRQRIAIARALYRDADLILLDEPFNELDEASELSLLQYFSRLARSGKMVILITHNKSSLSFCNKTLSLDEG